VPFGFSFTYSYLCHSTSAAEEIFSVSSIENFNFPTPHSVHFRSRQLWPASEKDRNTCCCRYHIESNLFFKSCMKFRKSKNQSETSEVESYPV
jgi:hypothetical protein